MQHSITPEGDLLITPSPDELAAVRELQDEPGFHANVTMYDIFEHLICNSELNWISPEEIAALTAAPILGIRAEDGTPERVWWFPAYEVRSPQEDIAAVGSVTFAAPRP